MLKRLIIFAALFILLPPFPLQAQTPIAEIPYNMENNRIKLFMDFQGHELRLMLDTGASTSVFFQNPVFNSQEILEGPLVTFPAFDKNYRTLKLPNITLSYDTFSLKLDKAVLMPEDEQISAQLSLGYDGILGQELFQKYIIIVDPDTMLVSFYPLGTDLSSIFSRYHELKMVGSRPHVIFKSQLPWEKLKTHKEFLIDTGYPGSIVIWDKNQFTKAAQSLNRSFLKQKDIGIVSYANFSFASQHFVKVPIFLGANPPQQIDKGIGLIGASLLNHFKYGIDFQNGRLWTRDRNLTTSVSKQMTGTIYTPNDETFIIKKFHFKETNSPIQVIQVSGK